MVIKEERSHIDDIDFQHIKKCCDYIRSRATKSYQSQKPIGLVESANIADYVEYLQKAIDILWEASKV